MKRFLRSTIVFGLAALAAALAPSASAEVAAPTTRTATHDAFWPADGVFPVPGNISPWTGFPDTNRQRRTLFAQRKELDRDGIVFVGDSITQGWRTLEADFTDLLVRLANRGISGDTTPNLVYRLQDDVLSLHPRGVVVLIGTNDLGADTTPEQVARNCQEVHRRIRAAYPRIPMAWCLVMPRGGENFLPRIRDLNARIVEFVHADPNATVCDTFTILAQENGAPKPEAFNADLLHLNTTGYLLWREALKPILVSWKLGGR